MKMINNWLAWQAAQINWWVVVIFILGMLPQVFFSSTNGTFFTWQYRHVDLPLAWHWGVLVGDPLLAIFMGRIWADLHFSAKSILFIIASIIISWFLHQSWRGISGHMFYQGHFVPAGWCHLVYFIVALELILEFIFTPMPRDTVLAATYILLIFIPFAIFEPGLAEWINKVKHDPAAIWFCRSSASLFVAWAATITVAYCKT